MKTLGRTSPRRCTELQLEDLEAANAEKQEQTEKTLAPATAAAFAAGTRTPARRLLPDHLPRARTVTKQVTDMGV